MQVSGNSQPMRVGQRFSVVQICSFGFRHAGCAAFLMIGISLMAATTDAVVLPAAFADYAVTNKFTEKPAEVDLSSDPMARRLE